MSNYNLKSSLNFGFVGNQYVIKEKIIKRLNKITNSSVNYQNNKEYFEYETQDTLYYYLNYSDQDFLRLNISGYLAADIIVITISSQDYSIDYVKKYIELAKKFGINEICSNIL